MQDSTQLSTPPSAHHSHSSCHHSSHHPSPVPLQALAAGLCLGAALLMAGAAYDIGRISVGRQVGSGWRRIVSPPSQGNVMTLAEIARLAGVSRTTASYVINGKAEERRISPQTVERVMAVVRKHRYRVDAQAAALRRGSSRTLGLIVPDLENTSYARLAKRLERGAREQGYQLLIVGSDDRHGP